eukprot:gene12337-16547_t
MEMKESSKLLDPNSTEPKKNFYFLKKEKSQASDSDNIPNTIKADESSSLIPTQNGSNQSWFGSLFQRKSDHSYQAIEAPKPRKVPVKVEPKVFFANERTFLAWLHMSVTLASISVAIVAFAEANEWSQIYGLLLMPVAIAFCVYSLWMYMKRSAMIRRKDPGPFLLASMLGLAILVNFGVKLYDYST